MLVIGNGRMITQDASNPFLENGAVAMDGNTIVMVGDVYKRQSADFVVCVCAGG